MLEMSSIWVFNENAIWSSLFLIKLYEHLTITSVHSELVPINGTLFQLVHLFGTVGSLHSDFLHLFPCAP
jgi:hypothetical protein